MNIIKSFKLLNIIENAKKHLVELLWDYGIVLKKLFEVSNSIKALFSNDLGEIKNTLKEITVK